MQKVETKSDFHSADAVVFMMSWEILPCVHAGVLALVFAPRGVGVGTGDAYLALAFLVIAFPGPFGRPGPACFVRGFRDRSVTGTPNAVIMTVSRTARRFGDLAFDFSHASSWTWCDLKR
jgi:hypothetical protein